MNKYYIWLSELTTIILSSRNEGLIHSFNEEYNLPIKGVLLENKIVNRLSEDLLTLYQLFDGFELKWSSANHYEYGGNMHFLTIEEIIKSWKGSIYNEEDIEQNDMIEFFHPFDLITEEAQCGILITPDFISNSIFYNKTGMPDLYDLDIDFDGYMEMAKEARVFYYWPKVLLDIQCGQESVETTRFKKGMPKIFPDFTWNAFVQKYESLRISKKNN